MPIIKPVSAIRRRLIFVISALAGVLSVMGIVFYIGYKAETEGARSALRYDIHVKEISPQETTDEEPSAEPQGQYIIPSSGTTASSSYSRDIRQTDNRGTRKKSVVAGDRSLSSVDQLEDDNYIRGSSTEKANSTLGFTAVKEEFSPSTAGFIEQAKQATGEEEETVSGDEKEEQFFVKLSGSLAPEFFIFGIYNTINEGKLMSEGALRLSLRGEVVNENMRLSFLCAPANAGKKMQLPIILNGHVNPASIKGQGIVIDTQGVLLFKKAIKQPIGITYSITRRTENSTVSMKFPISPWLRKEFNDIPAEIKGFLDIAKGSDDTYALAFISAVLNRCFGYQRDILPVSLGPKETWTSRLKDALSANHRLACDCDVLSTYAFIFLRYIGIPAVVCVGYDNGDLVTLDTLSPEEHHALDLVKVNGEWLFFDPALFVPDISMQLMHLDKEASAAGKAEDNILTAASLDYKISNCSAKHFTIPINIATILGDLLFSEAAKKRASKPTPLSGIELLKAVFARDETVSSSRDEGPLKKWTDRAVLFALGALGISTILPIGLSFFWKVRKEKPRRAVSYWLIGPAKAFFLASLWYLIGPIIGIKTSYLDMPAWSFVVATELVISGALLVIAETLGLLRIYLAGRDSDILPWQKKGLLRLSRNPAYAGYYLISIGASLYSPGPLALFFTAATIFFHHLVVKEEEGFFIQGYKEPWQAYARQVPRYL